MSKIRWIAVILVCGCMLMASLGACAPAEEITPTAPEEAATGILVVGNISPLTGPGASWGIYYPRGTQMAADEINERGGLLVNGKRYKIEVIAEDDKYSSEVGAAVARKLIFQDKVRLIMGTPGSAPCLGIQTVTEPAHVLMICDSSTPKRIGPDKPLSFQMHCPAKERGPFMYEYMKENFPGIETCIAYLPDDETGYTDAVVLEKCADAAGFKYLGQEYYTRGTADHYPLLTRVLSAEPDLIDLGAGTPSEQAVILKQLHELGYDGYKSCLITGTLADMLPIAGAEALEGYFYNGEMGTGAMASDGERELLQKYVDMHGLPFGASVALSYDTFHMVCEVMEEIGVILDSEATDEDVDAVADYLEDYHYTGARGELYYCGEETFGIKRFMCEEFTIQQVQSGKSVDVARVRGYFP